MWKEPDPDPGGEPSSAPSTRELTDLKDQNEQQKLMIAQLKEMLRKEQSSVTQEKVDEYINTLSKAKAKKSRPKREESGNTERVRSIDSNKKEKVNLLKRQLEENKAKLAERGKNQRGIEEMVTQLKAQLNDSQQFISLTPVTMIETKNFEYNKTTSQEELYSFLLIKEKKINGLLERIAKQEATIIDLQENLKEKDSVIDARTKAITLMTDSLSKKGKDTLDALDDTKEQMRSMQENFVKLEAEMKARQLGLLNDLKVKNLEINELQDLNKQLKEENNELLKRNTNSEKADDEKLEDIIKKLKENLDNKDTIIEQKERQLKETLDDLERLKNIGMSVDSNSSMSDNEVLKLKKQLDDLNKNMIKVKAQSKSKIKDLTKKIESFKKINDANALIIQLQTENTKLSEKIAELEEEKGNMQLKMVESIESVKDITSFEEYQSLNVTLSRNKEDLEEKDKIISLLEADIVSLKQTINSLKDQVSGLTHLENAQVTSEMKSIQIEEQLDKVMDANASLRKELTNLEKEKKELNEKVEELIKEKHELSIKMESYIQENMELIDKLEKLSAEKVSSAESIEIVEGLTQQEKLELAAYQKTIDEPLKISQEDENLNESVLQLNEDTTELLKKIDMFNAERKEVMCKMEELREENTRLILKVNEIENNRDTLAETYEQLQTEKEQLQSEHEKLLLRTSGIESHDHVTKVQTSEEEAELAIQKIHKDYEKLFEENHELKCSLKELDSKVQEKYNLESELSKSRTKIDELESCLKTNLAEITNYQMIIEENKFHLIDSSNIINSLQMRLNERENDVKDLNEIINDLNNVVCKLQNENEKLGNFEVMETQVNELKAALNKQIEQAEDYSEEVAQNNDTIKDLNERLVQMKQKIAEMEHDVEMKNLELSKRDETITNLQIQLDEKEKKINIVIDDMKQKYLVLQKQLDGNSGSLERRIEEMSVKNKEQLEKMKKIAATLKKKNQAYQELEEKYNEEKEKWEREANKKETERVHNDEALLAEIKTLKEDIAQKTKTLEESSIRIEGLEQAKIDLQHSLLEAKHRHEKLNEVSLQQELSTSLHEDIVNPVQVNDEKLKELELIIETDEIELIHYKERVQVLEETVMRLTEERDQLRFQGSELERQLDVSAQNVEEKMLLEEQLGHKLEEVSANDEILTKKIEEATVENRELSQKTKEQEELITKLKVKLKKAHERVTELKSLQTSMDELEVTNKGLKKQLEISESNQRHTFDEYELLQKQYRQDYEKIESDYQTQMEELLDARNSLTVECEKLNENLKVMQDREEELITELTECREKAEQLAVTDGHQIKELTEELKTATEKWKVAIDLTESLNQQLQEVQKQVVVQTAEETVETILHKAVEEVFALNTVATQTENFEETASLPAAGIPSTVPTINWLGVQETTESAVQNWFTESQQQPTDSWFNRNADHSTPVDNSKDLKEKIRALEFLLYNIDKEKEEVVKECTGMVNELTRLIYEKVNQCTMNVSSDSTLASADLDLQIVQPEDITDSTTNQKELQQIEFVRCKPSCEQQSQPVIEEIIQPKQAYLTYQPVVEPFGENDDGWGWGPDDARLEEEHIKSSENVTQVRALRAEIEQLHEKLRTVQTEGDNLRDEIKQWQLKAGKLSKKYKELRVKNDQLVAMQTCGKKAEASDFFDLDAQIQEEFKSQISQLEKRIKEVETDLEKEKLEKANIVKRCDVLTAANDRMTEMKEIQDSEVLRWKRKYEDTEEKLKQQDWNTEGFSEVYKSEKMQVECSETVEELQNTIKELSLDNEELQALLNEQRQLRIDAEKSRNAVCSKDLEAKTQHLGQELLAKSKEFEVIVNEKEQMIENLKNTIEQKEILLQEFSEKNHEIEQVLNKNHKEEIDQMSELKIELESIINEKDAALNEMKAAFDKTTALNDSLMVQIKKLNDDLVELKCKYDKLQIDSFQNTQEINQRKIELESIEKQLQSELELKETNFNSLEKESSAKISNLEKELANQLQAYETLQSENVMKVMELERKLSEEYHKYDEANIIQLQSELQQQKQRYEEIQSENLQQIVNLEEELAAQKLKYDEIKFELDLKVPQMSSDVDKLSDLQNVVIEKDAELKSFKIMLDELNNRKAQIEQELKSTQEQLQEKQKETELMEVEMEDKLVKLTEELEMKWQEQVDERGNTVAESWKYHLSMVETEFAAVQEKLKTEIDELETKCNALVNENNELRKNVDAEIRNEVDRVSAMQQQINERQQTIQELNKTLLELQKRNEILEIQIHELQFKSESLEKQVTNKEMELSSLQLVVDTTQRQFEEKREVVEEIVKLLECNTTWPLSCEKGDILNEFQKQIQNYVTTIQEKENEVFKLREQLCQLEKKEYDFNVLNTQIAELQNELDINREKEDEILRFQEQMSSLQEKEDEVARLSRVESELQRMVFDLQTREEQEILRLNAVVDDYKMQLNHNQNKLHEMMKEKDAANVIIEDLKQTIDSLQNSYTNVSNLNQQFEELKNDSNVDVENLKMQISQLKQETAAINQAMFDCQQQLSIKTNELEQVNNQLSYSKQNNEILEHELQKVNEMLQTRDQEHENYKQTNLKNLESLYEEKLLSKENGIEMLRAQLNGAAENITLLNEQWNNENKIKTELEATVKQWEVKFGEQSILLEEENKQLEDVRVIIEGQVAKIEELKQELFEKSNDYDSLIAQMDIGRGTVTQQPKAGESQPPIPSSTQAEQQYTGGSHTEDDLSQLVCRAELDLALYMLHQRDVRCEELTVELTQLLEERDTLQLRLSNAIREKEEVRRKAAGEPDVTPSTSTTEVSTPRSKSSAIFLAASGTELATEPSEAFTEDYNLANKLSELRRVGYKKDKTFVDEQELRRFQQMSIMQQHIHEASKLPPEAAAKLVDASYTLSRDVQSPSKVLLNWLWGRSTPKVNDT